WGGAPSAPGGSRPKPVGPSARGQRLTPAPTDLAFLPGWYKIHSVSFGRTPPTRPQNRGGGAGHSEIGTRLMPRVFRKQYTRPVPADAARITHKGKPAVRFKGADGKAVVAFLTKKGDRYRGHSPHWYGTVAANTSGSARTRRRPN